MDLARDGRRQRPTLPIRLGISWLTNAIVLAVVTFGAAWFFVSLLMLVITKSIVHGFVIHGFWTAVKATLIVWVVNLALDFTPGPWQIGRGRRALRLS